MPAVDMNVHWLACISLKIRLVINLRTKNSKKILKIVLCTTENALIESMLTILNSSKLLFNHTNWTLKQTICEAAHSSSFKLNRSCKTTSSWTGLVKKLNYIENRNWANTLELLKQNWNVLLWMGWCATFNEAD